MSPKKEVIPPQFQKVVIERGRQRVEPVPAAVTPAAQREEDPDDAQENLPF